MTRGAGFWMIWVSFAYLLAGVNLINPLLPGLRSTLDIGAGAIAGLYALYLIALVPMLLTLPRLVHRTSARRRLIVSVLLMTTADVLHVVELLPTLAAGRIFMAAGVAVGTGAAAELAVMAVGERGRTLTATANTGGALIGTIAGGGALLLMTHPVAVAFAAHACCGLVLVIALRRLPPPDDHTPTLPHRVASARGIGGRLNGVLLGGFAFAGAGAVIVLGPTLFEQSGPQLGAKVAFVPMLLFIGAAITQRLARPSRLAIVAFALILVAGLSLMLAAVRSGAFPLLLGSAAIAGVGFGAVFVMGLAWTTRGADHVAQGAFASAYACTSYAFAGAVIIGGGVTADLTSASAALVTIIVVLAVTMCLWAALAYRQADPFRSSLGAMDPRQPERG